LPGLIQIAYESSAADTYAGGTISSNPSATWDREIKYKVPKLTSSFKAMYADQ
jgi:hypothetical protein